jgi:hypothetical protein
MVGAGAAAGVGAWAVAKRASMMALLVIPIWFVWRSYYRPNFGSVASMDSQSWGAESFGSSLLVVQSKRPGIQCRRLQNLWRKIFGVGNFPLVAL